MNQPDRPSLLGFLRALGVRRHLATGLAVGVAVAGAVYAYRVLELGGPTYDSRGSPALFLLLAGVLAVSVAGLVAIVLTLRAAVRRARELE